ncbi:transcription factor RF2a-like [Phragmites australis]|uniref:transcription factor RF2a-like n=1 Tax=Phragmites australis TaxID=29695 RepID=UPI002D77A8E6|nr:transcription factor RF2a-like [Phragmites australis]XP_062199369.1 transcription factor RF2a-like [Phragmites australis]
MNKDKAPMPGDGGSGDGLPPQSSRRAGAPPSSSTPPPEYDISRMPDFPTRNTGHRRAHSEILSLPDDLDLSAPGAGDGPSLSDENDEELFSMFLDVDKLNSSCGASSEAEAESSSAAGGGGEGAGLGHAPRPRHQHSQSMDESMSIKAEQLVGPPGVEGMSSAEAKKAVSAAKLAELALVDPKRAKRIWANRQSAARSKERKMRYIAELERKVQTLQTEATTLSAQLALLQRDTTGLTTENSELKIRLQTMEQQVHLQDALNDTLKAEVQRLKVATGQVANGGGGMMMNFGSMPRPFGGNQQMFHNNQAMQSMMATHQLQQLQLHSQPQQQQLQPQHQQQPLHPLQVQQLQQAAREFKMKGPIGAQGQWGDGKSGSSGS